MDNKEIDFLKRKLESEMENQYNIVKEKKYWNPSRFYQMLKEHGGYETALKLLSTKGVSEGFIKLIEYNRIDLSVEWLVLNGNKGRYRILFDEKIIKECEKRLGMNNIRK